MSRIRFKEFINLQFGLTHVEPRRRAIFGLSLLFVLVLASRRFSGCCSLIFSKTLRFQIVWGRGRRSTLERMCHLLFFLEISQITLFYDQCLTGCIAGSCVSNKSAVTRTEENSCRVSTMLHSPSLEPSLHTQIHPALKHVRKYYYFS